MAMCEINLGEMFQFVKQYRIIQCPSCEHIIGYICRSTGEKINYEESHLPCKPTPGENEPELTSSATNEKLIVETVSGEEELIDTKGENISSETIAEMGYGMVFKIKDKSKYSSKLFADDAQFLLTPLEGTKYYFIQAVADEFGLQSLSAVMRGFVSGRDAKRYIATKRSKGDLVVVQNGEMFCRGRVLEVLNEGHYVVVLYDYGQVIYCQFDDMLGLPPVFQTVPIFGMKVRLVKQKKNRRGKLIDVGSYDLKDEFEQGTVAEKRAEL